MPLYVPGAAVKATRQPAWGDYLYELPIELDGRLINSSDTRVINMLDDDFK